MRVLVAPDSFKGTISAVDACAAITRGVRGVLANAEVDECPLADGGEGTLEAVGRVWSGEARSLEIGDVTGWGQRAHVVSVELDEGARVSLIESAQVIGLPLVSETLRNPERLGSAALGRLLVEVCSGDESGVIVALGGSATVDGGAGMAQALGARFFDAAGREIEDLVAADLSRVQRIEPIARRWNVTALCDVNNPLLGRNGAARVFGPQKGATSEQVEQLEAGLSNLVRRCEEAGLDPKPDAPGAGAAGGLGFGLAIFLRATLVRGSAWVCGAVGFNERAARADLIITGEGGLDAQTARGKVVQEVVHRARKLETPVMAVAGTIEAGSDEVLDRLEFAIALDQLAGGVEEALREPARWLEEAARRSLHHWLRSRSS